MPKIERYRVTVDVHAYRLDDVQERRLDTLIRTFFEAMFPLGLAPGYPDLQLVEDRWPVDGMTDAERRKALGIRD